MIKLKQGDCQELLPCIPDNSVSLTLVDIPYGEVSQKSSGLRRLDRGNADTCTLDIDLVVAEAVRITTGSLYFFCGTEQISRLVRLFRKYRLTTRVGVWEKSNPSPMNGTRLWVSGLEFCVFARKPKAVFNEHCAKALWRHPVGRSKVHPTEKPVSLMTQLIEASSNAGDTVVDFAMGSGTTGVACVQTKRNFIGIELDSRYFAIAKQRIAAAKERVNATR